MRNPKNLNLYWSHENGFTLVDTDEIMEQYKKAVEYDNENNVESNILARAFDEVEAQKLVEEYLAGKRGSANITGQNHPFKGAVIIDDSDYESREFLGLTPSDEIVFDD